MKLQVLQEDLSKALNTSIRFIGTRSTLPILGNFLLEAKAGKLQILGTNLEMSIAINIGAKVNKEGTVTVRAKVFHELIGNLPPGQINIELIKEELKIESTDWSGKIPTSPPNDFPKIPNSINEKKSFTLKENELKKSLLKILFSSSLDELRPVLTGVLFIFKEENLTLVASDGFRLSKKTIKLEKDIKSPNLIIPRQSLVEITREIVGVGSVYFEVRENDNQLVVKVGDLYLSTRLIDGSFPDFEKIIPTSHETLINLDKNDLSRAVVLASIFAKDTGNVTKMIVKPNSVEITSEGAVGNQKGSIEAKVEGSPVEISFNYKFIDDFLNVCEGDSIEIKLVDSISPAIFTDPLDKDFLHLIMPVRIQN